jgi:hypothetical protein
MPRPLVHSSGVVEISVLPTRWLQLRRSGSLLATLSVLLLGAVALPACASAGVTVLEPADGSVVVGPRIHFKVEVNEPGCQTGGSKGALQIWLVSTPNWPTGLGGYGDWGKFSDGSPEIFEWEAEDFYGEGGGYGTWKLHADLFCDPAEEVESPTVTFTLAPPGTVLPSKGTDPAKERLIKELAESCAKIRGHVAEIGKLGQELDEGTEPLEKLSAAYFLIAAVLEKSGELAVDSPHPLAKAYAVLLGLEGAAFDTLSNVGDVAVAKFKADAQGILDQYNKLGTELAAECPGFSVPPIKLKEQIPLTQYYTIAKHLLGNSPLFLRANAKPDKGSGKENLVAKLRASNAAMKATGKKLESALSGLGANLTPAGAPAADVAATQKAEAKLAGLVKQADALRNLLPGAVTGIKIQKEALPKALRDKPVAKRLVGMTIGQLLNSPDLAGAEGQWLKELHGPLPFPTR